MAKKNKQKTAHLPRSIRRLFPNLKTCIDAHAPVIIEVKKADCSTAKRLDPTQCALAHAVKRQFHAQGAVIGLGASYIIKGNKAVRFHTPEAIRREIVSFDRHQDFAEGKYILVPKSPSLRLGREPRKGRTSDKKNQKRIVHRASDRVRVLEKGK